MCHMLLESAPSDGESKVNFSVVWPILLFLIISLTTEKY